MSFCILRLYRLLFGGYKEELSEISSDSNQDFFVCFCQSTIKSDESFLREHFRQCQKYQQESSFYKDYFSLPLRMFRNVHLLSLRAELLNILELLDNELKRKGYFNKTSSQINDNGNQLSSQFYTKCENCNQEISLAQHTSNHKSIMLENCHHTYCTKCLITLVQKDFVPMKGKITCKKCGCLVSLNDLESAFKGTGQFSLLKKELTQIEFNLVTCVRCHEQYQFVKGEPPNVELSQEMRRHYDENRFECYQCRVDQCKQCRVSPYHLNDDCESFQKRADLKICQFCQNKLKAENCINPGCQRKNLIACMKINKCGHKCYGVRSELSCPSCLICQSDLYQKCSICQECLHTQPCVESACGHIFHYECVLKRMKYKWPGPEISFTYCQCPLCKKWLSFNNIPELVELLSDANSIREEIENQRKKLLEPSQQNFQFFFCFRCQKPYYGGSKDCQELERSVLDETQMICPECQNQTCKTHGTEFLIYKCRFCCNKAQYYCWGTTHFCQECHDKQINGDYQNKKPISQLQVCQGIDKCPIGGKHKSNGLEQALGCSLCGYI